MLIGNMRVLSFCHYLQGPACTQYLADVGADVIKIEPLGGAFERHWSGGRSYVEGVSAFMMSANRNKRSLAIDLKRPESRPVLERLIDEADVIVENFRPTVMDRLGLGYDAVRARNPGIIYASATGLGATGPARDRPGQDLLMQARSGLMAVSGNHETGPVAVGAAVVDQHGGALLAMGILAAFARRLSTGEGTRVEASLFASAMDLQTEALTKYFASGLDRAALRRDRHVGSWYHDAPYGVYAVADGHLALSMNPLARLADALDSDPIRALEGIDTYAERDRCARIVAAELCDRRIAEVTEAFDRHGVWHERIQDYDDLRRDPQAIHAGAFREIQVGRERATLVNHPLRYDGRAPEVRRMPLQAGQDSREILADFGFAEADIERLVRDGVIRAAEAPAHDLAERR